jgi:serine/threonine-protein kinase
MRDLDPGPGSRLGEYVLDRVIGQGGMGTVYAATHAQLGRRAAIKVLSSRLAERPEHADRFLREARIVSRLHHPNVVQVYDFIESPETSHVAYVMELIDGAPLSQALRARGRFETREAIGIVQQILSALEAVHALPVIHRDLKPENILLAGEGPAVKILDFGIAKDPDSSIHTSTGMLLGTPAYMAPEQVAGDQVSPAADIYAVGEILFELIAGRRLFTGTNQEILMAKLAGQTPLGPFDHPLAPLIRRCLAPLPGERPSAGTIARELDGIGAAPAPEPSEEPIRTPAELALSTPPPARARARWTSLGLLAILALASALAIALVEGGAGAPVATPIELAAEPAAPAPPAEPEKPIAPVLPAEAPAKKLASTPLRKSVARTHGQKHAPAAQAEVTLGPDLPTPLPKDNLQGW